VLCNKPMLYGLCSVVDLSCIYVLFLAGAVYYTIIIIYMWPRMAAKRPRFFLVFLAIVGEKNGAFKVGEKKGAFKWAKKGCLQVGEKKGAFKWAKKGCLQVGEKKGAFKIKKTGFLEVCVNMLWDSHNFNRTRVYLLQNKRTTTEKLKQLVKMLLQSKQKKRLSNNLKKLFFGASSNSL